MIPTSEKQSRAERAPQPSAGARRRNPRLVNRPYLNRKKEKSHGITIYEGGNLVHLRAEKFKSKIAYEEGRTRGKIGEFSYKSRQRLMRKIAMIDGREAGLPVFLTLTYPEEWPAASEEWKRHIHKFIIYMVRKYPGVWGLWKMEFQKRGAPHFHFMLWGLPKIEGTKHTRDGKTCWRVLPGISSASDLEVFNWMNQTWYRIVGSQDPKHLAAGINLEPVQSWRGVTSYVSKYLGKTESGEFVPCEFTGRFWGVVQGHKWAKSVLEIDITEDVFLRYRRVLRKLQEKTAKRVAMEAKEKGRERPAWTRKQKQRSGAPVGIHWYLDSLTSVKLLAWAASNE